MSGSISPYNTQQQTSVIDRMRQQQNIPLPYFPVQNIPINIPQQSFGAGRFLTGTQSIPLNFNVPQTNYTPFNYVPSEFMARRSSPFDLFTSVINKAIQSSQQNSE